MGSTTLTLPTGTLGDHCCHFFNQLVFSIPRHKRNFKMATNHDFNITRHTYSTYIFNIHIQRYMNRASVSDINLKDCINHSILDAGLIVYHTPHQLAVTTLPLPPRHRVRLMNTDSSRFELEVVVCMH